MRSNKAMTFPDIPLAAVNRAAALLFSRRDKATREEAEVLRQDLSEKMEQIDRAIDSINGQLETRTDPEWQASARRALRQYYRASKRIHTQLKTCRTILSVIDAQNRRLNRAAKEEAAQAAQVALTDHKHALKMERISAAQEETRQWGISFRRLVRAEIGEQRFKALCDQANLETQNKTNP